MTIFLNLKKYLEKYGGRAIILIGIILILNTYRTYYSEKTYFNFPLSINQSKIVEEVGKIEYKSSETIEIENSYAVNETVERSGSTISVTGELSGDIDPLLAAFQKNRSYSSSFDIKDINSICERPFNPLYPVILRRLVYYMPKNILFNGQKWVLSACNGDFLCDYSLHMKKKLPEVFYFCSGTLDEYSVALSGEIIFNSKYSRVASSKTEITVDTDNYVSTWILKDRVKKK